MKTSHKGRVLLLVASLTMSSAPWAGSGFRLPSSVPVDLSALTGAVSPAALAGRPVLRPLKQPAARRSARPGQGLAAAGIDTAVLQSLLQRSRSRAAMRPVSSPQPLVDARQMAALERLQQDDLGDGLRVHFDPKSGTPSFIRMRIDPAGGRRPAARGVDDRLSRARDFLRNRRDLLKLEDPDTELALVRQRPDAQGNLHLRYRQMTGGLPVWGRELLLHLDRDSRVYLLSGRYLPSPKQALAARTVTVDEAFSSALADLGWAWAERLSAEEVAYPLDGGGLRPAWKLRLRSGLDRNWLYFVDAADGRVLHRIAMTQRAGSVVSATGLDARGQNRSFNAWFEGGGYYMIDPTFPLDDAPHDPLNVTKPVGDTYILDARNGDGSQLDFSLGTGAASGWDADAVSAMANTRIVYDYYKSRFGRDGIDGAQKNFLVAIHFEQDLNNAFWNGSYMVFGDGDNQVFSSLASCLDVTAHEMTHGVIETSAALIYENQSGALNESFADIFAVMVDRDDWTLGEDCTLAQPGYLRSMRNPAMAYSSQPTKMSEYQNLPNTPEGDNGGVHVNSGIPNRAAWLIAEGLDTEGLGQSIGRDKTEQVFYKALTEHLTASAQFIDARRATLQAAEELYGAGGAEVQAVAAAWDAVEVTEGGTTAPPVPDSTVPTSTPPVSGEDLMVYLYPTDGTRDFSDTDTYALYALTTDATGNYDAAKDLSLGNSLSAFSLARPVAYTDAIGTLVFYVAVDQNIYAADLNDLSQVHTQITTTGDIWSIAVSPDGRYLAWTSTDANDDTIHVLDIPNGQQHDYTVRPADYQQGESIRLDTVKFADALSFDYSGRRLVFDAYNCLSTQTSSCDSGGGYRYWSIGILDVRDGQLEYPFPNQSPAIDLSYPVFAHNNNFVLAVDYVDTSALDATGQVLSRVLTVDLERQNVRTAVDHGSNPAAVFSVPSFWGDDDALTLQVPSGDAAGTVGVRVGLDSQWSGNGQLVTINPYAVAMPVMHRVGQRQLTGRLEASRNGIAFGDVRLGEQASATLTLRNPGNSDIEITAIELTGNQSSAFSHNGTNMRLPQGTSVTLRVDFRASGNAGARSAMLAFRTDVDDQPLQISLTANAVSGNGAGSGNGGSGGGSSGGSGGGWPPGLLIGLSALWLLRRRYQG